MNLDFFTNLVNDVKSHSFTSQFIDELNKYLNNIKGDIAENQMMPKNDIEKHRKEDNLYIVVEKGLNSAYLQDVNTDMIFEETLFSDDLFNLLHNDVVVRFKDGGYIYENDITSKWMDSFISTEEHNQLLTELMCEPNFSKIDFKNTTFNIAYRDDNYAILNYGESHQDTLKVPNKLIDYWADNNSILYYNKEENLFHKV